MKTRFNNCVSAILALALSMVWANASACAEQWQAKVSINWDKVERVSKTTPTYQIVESARLRPTSPIHDQVYRNLHDLGAELPRFQAWFPFPKLAVAELETPHDGKTFWDFSDMDPTVVDFLEATKGHKVILNLATIPEWMFKTTQPVPYPTDPDVADYNYEQGTELRDPSMKEVAEYLLAWRAGIRNGDSRMNTVGGTTRNTTTRSTTGKCSMRSTSSTK